ncbi:M55 family metallopeptidase [Cellulosilyticum ruminicola]|uniref:M55 family metallopeptidase n=1 Tax=Cellulosilyticum ruminicola TaxID=425254 RepID=UPI0006D25165|nr:M55 family metallopeptidase [Cellulosilyticum ruminicola]
MKVYISADIEGVTGISNWDETHKGHEGYEIYRLQMTKEVAAACKALLEAGVTEILVKDAHEDGKNLIHELLPKEVKIISGWSNHPLSMIEGLDESFDAAVFIGYHSGADTNGSPLKHSLNPDKIRNIQINGEIADEFLIFAYGAYYLKVPVVAVTGDGNLIRHVRRFDSKIETVATGEGFGGALVSIHPEVAIERIYKHVKKAVEADLNQYAIHNQKEYELVVEFTRHEDAYKYSFYPGVEQISEYSVCFKTNDYMQVLSFLLFM